MLALSIQDIKIASKIVKNGNLPRYINKLSNGYYNCWGFTAFALKMVRRIYWLCNDDMENLLEKNTIPVNKKNLQNGDIVVYRGTWSRPNYLLHTAIIVDVKTEKIIHKNGYEALTTGTIYGTEYTSQNWKNETVTFRRMKNK